MNPLPRLRIVIDTGAIVLVLAIAIAAIALQRRRRAPRAPSTPLHLVHRDVFEQGVFDDLHAYRPPTSMPTPLFPRQRGG